MENQAAPAWWRCCQPCSHSLAGNLSTTITRIFDDGQKDNNTAFSYLSQPTGNF
jgi:hypothetical protein